MWFTVSKAFDMSKYIILTCLPLSSFVPIWSRASRELGCTRPFSYEAMLTCADKIENMVSNSIE